jgi:hypothetical protein
LLLDSASERVAVAALAVTALEVHE